jgi:hypothetical protein
VYTFVIVHIQEAAMKTHLKRILFIILILALAILACSITPGPTEKPSVQEDGSGNEESESTDPLDQGNEDNQGSDGAINAYRIHMVGHLGDAYGPITQEWTMETTIDPLAVHQTFSGEMSMEVYMIGTTMWVSIMGGPWTRSELSADEDWQTTINPDDLPVQVESDAQLDTSIEPLMGQMTFNFVEGSLTLVGEETVNGVPCKHYGVDSTYPYTTTFTGMTSGSAKITEQSVGDIWVADKAGWQAFIVKAILTKTTRTEGSGFIGEEAEYIEMDVTDINSPDIVINPPE